MNIAILSAMMSVGVVACSRESPNSKQQMPAWFRGPFQNADQTLKVHLPYGEEVFYTERGKYEKLRWRADGERVLVIRDANEEEQVVGYAVKGARDWHLEWHPSSSESPVDLQLIESRRD